MKILMFDIRESEKPFFETHKYRDFDITLKEDSLSNKTKLSDEELNDTCAISVYRSSILTSDILKRFKNLRIIATRSTGFTHIDLNYCSRNRIAVLNIEQYGERAVAEFALAIIIGLMRKVKSSIIDIHNHRINPKNYEGELLDKKTIGIIGCGKVGKEIAKIADFFNMKVLVSSYKESPQFDRFCYVVPFDYLLANSDIIVLHMPFTTETYQIIGEKELNKMKNGVYIVNTSSIELINLESLYNFLESGKVKGAGLDILESDYSKNKIKELGNETMSTKSNYLITRKLMRMPNVIITPHLAYNTKEYIDFVLDKTINNIKDYLKGMYTNRIC